MLNARWWFEANSLQIFLRLRRTFLVYLTEAPRKRCINYYSVRLFCGYDLTHNFWIRLFAQNHSRRALLYLEQLIRHLVIGAYQYWGIWTAGNLYSTDQTSLSAWHEFDTGLWGPSAFVNDTQYIGELINWCVVLLLYISKHAQKYCLFSLPSNHTSDPTGLQRPKTFTCITTIRGSRI